jgi:hypothetical protein
LNYERTKRYEKDNEQNDLSREIKLLLGALAECNPTDEDKLSFLELGSQRLVGRRRKSDPSLHAIVLQLLDKFTGEC